MDSEFDTYGNVEKIIVLDSEGESIDIKKGYRYEVGCKKQKDYVIGREEVVIEPADAATTEASESTETEVPVEKEYRDITGTVVVIELSTGDLRKEVDELKATLAEQSAAIDTLILGELEG